MQISRKVNKGKNRKPKSIPREPPSLPNVCRFGTVLRYQKTSASDAAVYANCLAKLICVATSATTGCVIYESIRVKRVTAYVAGVVNSGAGGFLIYQNAVAIRFDDSAAVPFGQERRIQDVPTTTRGAMVSSKMTGLNSMWVDANAAGGVTGQRFLTVTGPIGTIVDIKVSVQITINRTSAMANLAGAGLTTRVLYFNYLDNTDTTAAAAGTQFLQNINSTNATSFV